jgi:hypothetical protein
MALVSLRERMLGAERFVADGNRAQEEWLCFVRASGIA